MCGIPYLSRLQVPSARSTEQSTEHLECAFCLHSYMYSSRQAGCPLLALTISYDDYSAVPAASVSAWPSFKQQMGQTNNNGPRPLPHSTASTVSVVSQPSSHPASSYEESMTLKAVSRFYRLSLEEYLGVGPWRWQNASTGSADTTGRVCPRAAEGL
ncbi:hypothetical protein M440DRAFT_1390147 [Trichoderma longibrachiatum ATCC 18648]|uniref:Uncharacterized protein n=1 Tax=Trichoderma longibrachiatum ATCC 18648 TaxID=983965 RepID=A0A2T4CA84_TRILO|nr:hypothetical protein M440DRAFT_1390147 [Trichoderma longibrachiatum ATCC 18648]